MKVAVYSRKSKMTETGDSIKNQIAMCRDYALMHFGDCEFLVYEDEGFSGGNIERPMFKQMICDAKRRGFQALICYRLDRISRNVNDFSSTLKILEDNNIAFVSVTERFDTSTPLGKAMLSISSVFAELERDTIAQRITDNFTQLAKSGRYLTGRPPEGFLKKRITAPSGKLFNVLETVPEEADKIKLIYKKYLEWESFRKIEIYCRDNEIKTRSGSDIRPDWITRVLTHQLYATADERAYEFFASRGYIMTAERREFDGTHGIAVFRRTKSGKGRHMDRNNPENIMIGVGAHKGIVESEDWIAVQKKIGGKSAFSSKKIRTVKKAVGRYGVLNGILKCRCGSYMRPVCIRNGMFYYTCQTKEKSRGRLCGVKNIRSDIDDEVIKKLHIEMYDRCKAAASLKEKSGKIYKEQGNIADLITSVERQLARNSKRVENLIIKLADSESDMLIKHIEAQIEILDQSSKLLASRLMNLQSNGTKGKEPEKDFKTISDLAKKISGLNLSSMDDTLAKRNIIKSIAESVCWDGKALNITLKKQ